MTGQLRFICHGLERIHDDAARPAFLGELWARRGAVSAWMDADPYLASRFETAYLPTFLHGGSPTGRTVVMGINPGWNPIANGDFEEPFKQRSAEAYVEFHERFFEVFPALFAAGMRRSPWWTKLANVLSALNEDPRPAPAERFPYLSDRIVVQDLIPFHSARDLVRPKEVATQPALAAIASATLTGLGTSPARAVMAFSKQGHELIAPHLKRREDHTLRGGRDKRIDVATGYLGRTPALLVANQILVQPTFPHAELVPQLQSLMERFA